MFGAAGSSRVILAQSGTPVVAPNDLLENVLATILIPGGSMGPQGRLMITTSFNVTLTVIGTYRVRFSGIGGNVFAGPQVAITTVSFVHRAIIMNADATNVQTSQSNPTSAGGQGTSGIVLATGAVDTEQDTTVVLTFQKGAAADVVTLMSLCVELTRP